MTSQQGGLVHPQSIKRNYIIYFKTFNRLKDFWEVHTNVLTVLEKKERNGEKKKVITVSKKKEKVSLQAVSGKLCRLEWCKHQGNLGDQRCSFHLLILQ